MPTDKKATTWRLSAEARELLARLAARDGLTLTAVLEMMIRERARAVLPAGEAKPRGNK